MDHKYLTVKEATSLREFNEHNVHKGTKIFVLKTTNHTYFLSKNGKIGTSEQSNVFYVGGVEGEDFSFNE